LSNSALSAELQEGFSRTQSSKLSENMSTSMRIFEYSLSPLIPLLEQVTDSLDEIHELLSEEIPASQ